MNQERIDAILRYLRENKLTQQELCEKVGISPPLMSNYINGHQPIGKKNWRKIEQFLGEQYALISLPKDQLAETMKSLFLHARHEVKMAVIDLLTQE